MTKDEIFNELKEEIKEKVFNECYYELIENLVNMCNYSVEKIINKILDEIQGKLYLLDYNFVFDNVELMKKSDLSIGDKVWTKGYYNINDGGGAVYEITSYEEWYSELPNDIKAVAYRNDRWGLGTPLFYKTAVDEFGNHTLDNGLVAKIVKIENITYVEQWGCIGDGKFNNTEALIHLFAHTKNGTIKFKENKIYLLKSRSFNRAYYDWEKYCKDDDWGKENIKNYNLNEYIPLMCGNFVNGSSHGKPVMANINGVILDGNNCKVVIDENDFCKETVDFGLFELGKSIVDLEIKNFNFDCNGLTQKGENTRTTNHTIVYLPGFGMGYENDFGGEGKTLLSLGIKINDFLELENKFSNIYIHDNTFKNSGTIVEEDDQGGDFILILNPDKSDNVYIEDNYFENWGRWVFAVDLGGNGEQFDNYRFNRNRCILNENNCFKTNNGEVKYRGKGWIDLEARKRWTNLEIMDNYVEGLPCFAINGDGKVSENVTISGNTIIRKELSYYSAYQYMFYFYGVQMKNLVFENNIERGNTSSTFGYTLNNITIKGNDLRNCIDIDGIYGDIVIENNHKENDRLDTLINVVGLSLPDYLDSNEELVCNFKFNNNRGGVVGRFYDLDNPGKYKFIKFQIENNVSYVMNIRAFDSEKLYFDQNQITTEGLNEYYKEFNSWCVRGAILTKPFVIDSSNIYLVKRGGYLCSIGDVLVVNNTNEKIVCTKSGYLPIDGAWGFAEADKKFLGKDTVYSPESYIYTDKYLYVSLNSGILGENEPNHISGVEVSGDVKLRYLCDMAQFNIIDK